MKIKPQYLSAALVASALLLARLDTHAQTLPWQNYTDVPGRAFTAMLDPFSANAAEPSIFFGGPATDNGGCSIGLIGAPDALACSDSDAGTPFHLGHDVFANRLYSVGSSGGRWQVRESADAGGTWQTVDTYSVNNQSSGAAGFASDGNGNVFVCGWAKDSAGDTHWIVRKRNSIGVWSMLRDRSERRKIYKAARVHAENGYVFVVGEVADKWAVERLNSGNNTWDLNYTFAPKGKRAGAVAVTSRGTDLYVLGSVGGVSEAPEQCVLQRSANHGAGAWQTVKTFSESVQINRPRDLAFDTLGNLYVVGEATFQAATGDYKLCWIVRRHSATAPMSDGWQWWLPRGGFPAPSHELSSAKQACPDAFGNVFLIGTADIYNPGFTDRRIIVQKWLPPQ